MGSQQLEGEVVGVAGHRAVGDKGDRGEHLCECSSQKHLVKGAVGLRDAVFLGTLNKGRLGVGSGHKVGCGLGDKGIEPQRLKDLIGHEDGGEHDVLGVLEGARHRLQRQKGRLLTAGVGPAVRQKAALGTFDLEGLEQPKAGDVGAVVHDAVDGGSPGIQDLDAKLLVVRFGHLGHEAPPS